MVGDNPVNDIGGGRSAGLRTLWIANKTTWPPHLPDPDRAVLDSLEAIHLLLDDDHTRSTT
ncbi:HAD hydrolase-like protein [Streptomyces sp. S1D4-11]|nr:HAD hydrolase-like protein [Streptomyces sp. S1D4-11]